MLIVGVIVMVGEIGTVNDYESDDSFRVHIDDRKNKANWHSIDEVEVLQY